MTGRPGMFIQSSKRVRPVMTDRPGTSGQSSRGVRPVMTGRPLYEVCSFSWVFDRSGDRSALAVDARFMTVGALLSYIRSSVFGH